MNISERELATNDIIRRLTEVIRVELNSSIRTCITCDNFTEKTEVCELAKCRPPARVIANGCSSYEEVVPF
jgi:hypothetical protein